MDATEDGIEIWVNFEHPLNVPSSIFFIEEESSIWCKDAHLLNAYSPIRFVKYYTAYILWSKKEEVHFFDISISNYL